MYEYRAIVVSVYDGDTITVDIDLGFGVWKRGEKVRLLGINSPEVRGESRERGIVARDALRAKIGDSAVTLRTKRDKQGKYGRYLAVVVHYEYGPDFPSMAVNINDWMVENGFAEVYHP